MGDDLPVALEAAEDPVMESEEELGEPSPTKFLSFYGTCISRVQSNLVDKADVCGN